MAGPWEKYQTVPAQNASQQPMQQPRVGRVFSLPPDPQETRNNARQDRNDAFDHELQRQRLQIAQQAGARADAAAKAAQAARDLANRQMQMQLAQRRAPLDALNNQLHTVWDLYAKGPGATKGLSGLADYLPGGTNAAFDAAGASLAEIGQNAFRTPGIGSQSDKELAAFVQANRPYASDWDTAAVQKMKNLENRLAQAYKAMGVPYKPYRPKGFDTIAPGASQNRVIDFNDLP